MFKQISTLALLVATASAVSAAPSEASYSYTGPKRDSHAVKTYSASVVPGPTTWVPSHKRPYSFTPAADTRYWGTGAGVAGFSMPSFSQPSFSTETFSQPSFSAATFASPSFSQPGFSTPGFSQPGFSTPGFSQPSFAKPSFVTPSF